MTTLLRSTSVSPLLSHTISNLRKEAALEDRDPDVRKAIRIASGQIEGAAQ